MAPPPPPPLTWVLLARVARRTDDEDVVPQGGGIRLEPARPPRITFVALPAAHPLPGAPRGTSGTTREGAFIVVAADEEAGLLVAFSRRDMVPLEVAPRDTSLYVLSEDASVIAIRSRETPVHLGNLGLMPLPGRDGCLVAELHHSSASARLLTYRSGDAHWIERELSYPEEALLHRAWGADGVFRHDGLLWWVDLRRGILSCDPLDDDPVIVFHSLPAGSIDAAASGDDDGMLRATRCVNVSDGRIRFAEVRRDTACGAAEVVVWTSRDGGGGWSVGARRPLADIWGSQNYDNIVPEVVLVHPRLPFVVYLFLKGHVMAADLVKNMLLETEEVPCQSWRDVLLWELPQFVSPDRFPHSSGSISGVPGWDKVHLGHAQWRSQD